MPTSIRYNSPPASMNKRITSFFLLCICTLAGVQGLAAESPTEQLKPLVLKIDTVLGLQFDEKGPGVETRATILRGQFAGQHATAAEKDRPHFAAAMVVCDELIKAMTAKRAMKERMMNSGVFHGKGKVGSKKKGPTGNEKFFADKIKADWRAEKTKLMAAINGAFEKLSVFQANQQK